MEVTNQVIKACRCRYGGSHCVAFFYLDTITDHLVPYCGLKIGYEIREEIWLMYIEVRKTGRVFRGDVKEKLEDLFGGGMFTSLVIINV